MWQISTSKIRLTIPPLGSGPLANQIGLKAESQAACALLQGTIPPLPPSTLAETSQIFEALSRPLSLTPQTISASISLDQFRRLLLHPFQAGTLATTKPYSRMPPSANYIPPWCLSPIWQASLPLVGTLLLIWYWRKTWVNRRSTAFVLSPYYRAFLTKPIEFSSPGS